MTPFPSRETPLRGALLSLAREKVTKERARRRKVRLLRFRLRRKLRSLPCSSSPHKA